MLTSELMRVSMRKGVIKPSFIKEGEAKLLELAATLIDLYDDHVGHTRGELDEALHNLVGSMPQFRLVRGLAKILERRSKLEIESPTSPPELRTRLFELAAAQHPISRRAEPAAGATSRYTIIKALAAELECTPEAVETGLFADLRSEQRIVHFETLAPEALLARYNVALAQGVLMRASSMTLDIQLRGRLSSARYRQLFRYIKFHQLLHTVTPRKGGGYTITVDGPMSIFQHSGKYGFQMACFLPALLLCKGWSMEARVLWGKARKPYAFKLSAEDGLTSHYVERGVYLTEEEELFIQRFEKYKSTWKLDRDDVLINLGGQGLLVPDFRIRNTADDREAYLEVIGYWRADYLQRRIQLLSKKGPKNLILAVSERLKTDKIDLESLPVEVFFYKRVIRPAKIMEAVERVALPAEKHKRRASSKKAQEKRT